MTYGQFGVIIGVGRGICPRPTDAQEGVYASGGRVYAQHGHNMGHKILMNAKRFNKSMLSRQTEREVIEDIRRGGLQAVVAFGQAIRVVYPYIEQAMMENVVVGTSYDMMDRRRGVPLNRADFYGCRRKVLAIYAKMRGIQ